MAWHRVVWAIVAVLLIAAIGFVFLAVGPHEVVASRWAEMPQGTTVSWTFTVPEAGEYSFGVSDVNCGGWDSRVDYEIRDSTGTVRLVELAGVCISANDDSGTPSPPTSVGYALLGSWSGPAGAYTLKITAVVAAPQFAGTLEVAKGNLERPMFVSAVLFVAAFSLVLALVYADRRVRQKAKGPHRGGEGTSLES